MGVREVSEGSTREVRGIMLPLLFLVFVLAILQNCCLFCLSVHWDSEERRSEDDGNLALSIRFFGGASVVRLVSHPGPPCQAIHPYRHVVRNVVWSVHRAHTT